MKQLREDMDETFNVEIVRELLLKENAHITNAEVDKIWSLCKGNPWDAPLLYKMMKLK